MDIKVQDPVTGAKADTSDPGGSLKSIAAGAGGVALGLGVLAGGKRLFNTASQQTEQVDEINFF